MSQFQPDSPATPAVNAKRLWAGGAATALVAALAAVVGLLIVRGILDTPVITPERMPGIPKPARLLSAPRSQRWSLPHFCMR